MALMAHPFVDISAWFVSVNRLDADHARIRSLFQTVQGRLVTSSFSFDETVILCLYRLMSVPTGVSCRHDGWRGTP
jgi:hypothetical protein